MIKYIFLAFFAFSNFLSSQKIQPNMKLNRIDGKRVSVQQYLTKGPILINFWATWCGPCKKEMLHLDKLASSYKNEGFSILSISIDTQRSFSEVKRYVRAKRYNFDVFIDPNQQVFKKLNGNIMPTNILVDEDGSIAWMHYGYMPGDEKNMEKEILKVLNQ